MRPYGIYGLIKANWYNVADAHKELASKGVKVNDVKDDLFGPGSGVKWFNLEDPDGNQVLLVQA